MNVIGMIFGKITLASAIRTACPLIIAASGGCFCHSVGVFNFAYECFMLSGAFFAAYGAHISGSFITGAMCSCASGLILALIFGIFVFKLKANPMIVSVALNMGAWALTTLLLFSVFGQRGTVVSKTIVNYPKLHFAFLDRFPAISYILNDNIWMVYFAYIMAAAAFFIMYKTKFGLHCRGTGINPQAAKTTGINIERLRWKALLIMGFFAGLAGSYMPMSGLNTFSENMTSGVGFLVFAAILVGKGNPLTTTMICFLFAYTDALSTVLTALEFPIQLVATIPYAAVILTLFVVGLHSFKAKARVV